MMEKYIENLKMCLDALDDINIELIINVISDTINSNGKIIIFGNGGSLTTASHFSCDFNKMLNYQTICLNDMATITAIGNDIDFNSIFSEQLKTLCSPNDIIIGLSTSGNSKNVINAFYYAKSMNIKTISFTGFDGGELKKISDYNIHINIHDTQISEDLHLILTHILLKKIIKKQ